MARYTIVFHAFLGDEGPNKGPLSQEMEYQEYPVVPRIGEEIITRFDALCNDTRWQVRSVRHFGHREKMAQGAIIDLRPAHDGAPFVYKPNGGTYSIPQLP